MPASFRNARHWTQPGRSFAGRMVAAIAAIALTTAGCVASPLIYSLSILFPQPPDYNDQIIGRAGPLVAISRSSGGFGGPLLRSKGSAETGPAALTIFPGGDALSVVNVDTLAVDREPAFSPSPYGGTGCDGRWLVSDDFGQSAGRVVDLQSGAEIMLGDGFDPPFQADFAYVVSHDRVLAAGARFGSTRLLLAAFDLPAGTQRFITEVEISATRGLRGVAAFDGEWIAIPAYPPATAVSLEELGPSEGIELFNVVTGEHRSIATDDVVRGALLLSGDRILWTDQYDYYRFKLLSYSISSGQTQTLADIDEQFADSGQLIAAGPAGALLLLQRDAFAPPPADPVNLLTPGRVTHTYWFYRFDAAPLTIAEELLDTFAAQPTLDPPTAAVTDTKVLYREFTTTYYRIYDIATGQSTVIDPFAE